MTTETKYCGICGDMYMYHPSGYDKHYHGISLNNEGICAKCIKEYIDLKIEKNIPIKKFIFRYKEIFDNELRGDIFRQIIEYQGNTDKHTLKPWTVLPCFVGGNDDTAEEFMVVRSHSRYIYHRDRGEVQPRLFIYTKYDLVSQQFTDEPFRANMTNCVLPVSSATNIMSKVDNEE